MALKWQWLPPLLRRAMYRSNPTSSLPEAAKQLRSADTYLQGHSLPLWPSAQRQVAVKPALAVQAGPAARAGLNHWELGSPRTAAFPRWRCWGLPASWQSAPQAG